jgi:NurA-like 5'-3' nuclease
MDQDQENILKEFFQLKEEHNLLQEEKQNLYHDRKLAGELGNTLLEQNKELESKLEEMNAEYTSIIIKMEVLLISTCKCRVCYLYLSVLLQ